MPIGLNAFKRRSRSGLLLPGAGMGGAGLQLSVASGPSVLIPMFTDDFNRTADAAGWF